MLCPLTLRKHSSYNYFILHTWTCTETSKGNAGVTTECHSWNWGYTDSQNWTREGGKSSQLSVDPSCQDQCPRRCWCDAVGRFSEHTLGFIIVELHSLPPCYCCRITLRQFTPQSQVQQQLNGRFSSWMLCDDVILSTWSKITEKCFQHQYQQSVPNKVAVSVYRYSWWPEVKTQTLNDWRSRGRRTLITSLMWTGHTCR